MRSTLAVLAGATTTIVLPGTSASGLIDFVMREGNGKKYTTHEGSEMTVRMAAVALAANNG
jgi:hypothetical protein